MTAEKITPPGSVPSPMAMTRTPRDLNLMLYAIAAFEMASVAETFDGLCRATIEKRFAKLPAEMRERAMARLKN